MPSIKWFDWLLVLSALAFNLIIAALFIAQKRGATDLVDKLGRAWLLLAIPLLVVLIAYLGQGKPVWVWVAFGVVLAYMLAEFLLDYVFHFDFRAQWSTHIPYIILEYAALFGLIALTTAVNKTLGWIVGGSFWVLMGSLIYLYAF